jgi:hypothetical protein
MTVYDHPLQSAGHLTDVKRPHSMEVPDQFRAVADFRCCHATILAESVNDARFDMSNGTGLVKPEMRHGFSPFSSPAGNLGCTRYPSFITFTAWGNAQ